VQIANPPGGGTTPAALRASASEQLATAETRIQLRQLAAANTRISEEILQEVNRNKSFP
jgi:hypothetical protein